MGLLDNLQHHAIFKRLPGSAAPLAAGASDIRQSKVAVRGDDEVFFAHSRSVRCSKVSQSQQFKTFDSQLLDFDISGVKMNSSGTLLAVYNESNLVVVSLPPSNFMLSEHTQVAVASFEVGKDFLTTTTKITDLQWNDIARFDSSIVVLYSDGHLRSFNLSTSTTEPESAYNLTSPPYNSVGLVTNTIAEPVGMTFGSHKTLAGSLTLYIIGSDGDVFSIFPFAPQKLAVEKDLVEDLLNESVLWANEIIDGTSTTNKRRVVSQLKFVKALWQQIPTCHREIRGLDELCVLEAPQVGPTAIQGPFAIQPYPEALYDDEGVSIDSVDCGEGMYLLAVSFAQNGFALLLPDPQLTMRFQDAIYEDFYVLNDVDNDDEEEEDVGLTLSLLDFKVSSTKTPCTLTTIGDKTLLLQRGSEIFELGLEQWEKYFKETYHNVDSEAEVEPASTKFYQLKSLSHGETFEGFASFKDEYGAVSKCLVTNKSFDVFAEKHTTTEPKETQPQETETYKPKLGVPFSEIQKLTNDIRDVRIVPPADVSAFLSSEEGSLRDMSDVSSQVSKQLIKFHKLSLYMNRKLEAQATEFRRQLDLASDLQKREAKLKENSDKISTQFETVNSRQENIVTRFQTLAEKLQTSVDLPLSTKEKAWFREISQLVMSYNKYAKQSVTMKEQVGYIKSEIESKSQSTVKEPVEFGDWENINRIMEEGRQLAEKTSQSLEGSLVDLNQRFKETRV